MGNGLKTATLLAGLMATSSVEAATSIVNTDYCNPLATVDQCASSGWVNLSAVTSFRFSVRGDGYDPFFIGTKRVIIQYLKPDKTWACLGDICRAVSLPNTPPDAFGNHEHWSSPSTTALVPLVQRLLTTQLRAVPQNAGANVSKVTIQLNY